MKIEAKSGKLSDHPTTFYAGKRARGDLHGGDRNHVLGADGRGHNVAQQHELLVHLSTAGELTISVARGRRRTVMKTHYM